MPFDAATLQVSRKYAYDQSLAKSRALESTLIPGAGDNDILLGVFDRLRTASPPRDVSPHRRKVTTQINPLTIVFYSKKVEDFVKKDGTVSDMFARRTARKFTFGRAVTVTRERQDGVIFWCLTDGERSLSIGERGTVRTGLSHRPLRSSGFAQPTGNSAGYRTRGWGPRAETE